MHLPISTILITLSVVTSWAAKTPYQEIPTKILHGVEKLRETKEVSQGLKQLVEDLYKINPRKNANSAFCESCKHVIDQIIDYRHSGASKESMTDFIQKLCNTFSNWGKIACDGYVNIEIDTILFIIDNNRKLTPERVCATVFQIKNCKDPNGNKWNVDIKPSNSTQQTHIENLQSNVTSFKILHLTDFHYDPLYEPGSNAVCDMPLCCQKSNGPPSDPKNAAGFWGDYNVCDMPWHSVLDLTEHIKNNKKNFDFVYYTGDIISHKSWATTKDHNANSIKAIYKLFKDTFKNIPVFPVLGNHEPHPTDFYSPGSVANTKISTQWVFDLVAEEWSRWLPEETKKTIRDGGYYTVLVRPGFRIIALNSNVCFTSNLWLLYEEEDPYNQLKWLVQILTEAEKAGEKVHILSHIPPGHSECLERWAYQFRRIVNRFAPIISSQFNGHTHLDELRVIYDLENPKKVINVAFNGGSFTTFVGFNPNFRIYDIDSNNLKVLDYDHYIYNLTVANQDQTKSPNWFKLYSLKSAYGMSGTSYKDFDDLIRRMKQDQDLVKKYYRLQGRESEAYLAQKCDEKCLAQALCTITAADTKEIIQCADL